MAQMLTVEDTSKGANTQVQVFRNNNGSFLAFGNPFTPAGSALQTDGVIINKANMAAQFGKEFFCVGGQEIRKYNPSTQNWDLHLDKSINNTIIRSSGLYTGRGPSGALRLVNISHNGG